MDQASMKFFKQALEHMCLKLENKMEENSEPLKSDLENKVEENSESLKSDMKNKMKEFSKFLKYSENEMDENNKFLDNTFFPIENKLEHELSSPKDQIGDMETEIDECSRFVDECSRDVDRELDEYFRKVHR